MNGAPASFARRRAISVFPTPVGPMRMMLFGEISLRMDSGACWRRQRLRSAMATAFLASACPTMYRSSSATICRGVRSARRANACCVRGEAMSARLEHGDVGIGVHADLAGDRERLAHDVRGGELRVDGERTRRGERVRATRSNGEDAVVRLDQLSRAGDDEPVCG